MHLAMRLIALIVVSHALLGTSAGRLVKRQADTASASPEAPTTALIASSAGAENASVTAPPTSGASKTIAGATSSRTDVPPEGSRMFAACRDPDAKPFCRPSDNDTLFVGQNYFATWNRDFFPVNSTVTIKVLLSNDSSQEVWSSEALPNALGYVTVKTSEKWLSGYDALNLTFIALNSNGTDFDGPDITITYAPKSNLEPSAATKIHKQGLMIGLPVGLGFVVIVVAGLLFGMRKHRTIGIGNIMGRKNRGYGAAKSKRERLGFGKKGPIRLEVREDREAEAGGRPLQTVAPSHARSDSLGSLSSLVSNGDYEIQPSPRGNHFRDEMERQRTGR